MKQEKIQEIIDKLNAEYQCPQGCPGNDFNIDGHNIVCGCCGWIIATIHKLED